MRHTALPKPGSWEQLIALTTRVQEQLLDRERPLWEIWFVEGLEDGHVAIIQKTHHSLIDGVSGVDVATLLLDATPDYVPPVVARVDARAGADAVAAAHRQLARARDRARRVPAIVPLDAARSAPRGRARGRAAHARFGTMVNRDSIAPRTSINARTGRHRLLSVVRVPLADVKTIRKALGGTVNDVLLAGVGGGLNRLLTSRGDDVDDLRLRVLCPVSVRSDDQRGALGNKISAIFVSLPVGAGRSGRSPRRDHGADRRPQGEAAGA